MFENISFLPGQITTNETLFDPSLPTEAQLDIMREDMFQARLQNDWILDIGWYPSFKREGRFLLLAVEGFDWEHPIISFEARDYATVESEVAKIVATLRST